ncbi:MAG: terminase family protein [Henriciella sp.]|uniref:DNA-packaging protein n=1 Tax=Henriciella sp. TaxID=1968823 RepID=UPI0032EC3ED3
MGGRGSGKTRAGAEWVRRLVLFGGYRRIALVGPTFNDVREVMIEGFSGLRSIMRAGERAPEYEVSRHRLVWPNGAEAHAFSAEDPDGLRGPQFDAAWCDEVAAWQNGRAVWDMLQMTLRLGPNPRIIATTTPRRVPLVRALVEGATVAVTRSATRDNAENLSPVFLDHVERLYGNSDLGRQELAGELLDEESGALWTRALIDLVSLTHHPGPLTEIVVAVDPPAGVGATADACGIVAAGTRRDAGGLVSGYVLADATVRGLSPIDWATRVIDTASRVGASRIIAESNQGGEMVRTILLQAGCRLPIILKHARVSKRDRALPVFTLYQQGRVFHLGPFSELEKEMVAFGTAAQHRSPDRVDALVWAFTVLMVEAPTAPSVRRL